MRISDWSSDVCSSGLTGVEADAFWKVLSDYLTAFAPRNRALLDKRDMLQARIDEWHRTNPWPFDAAAYEAFLREIGYLQPEPDAFSVGTASVDPDRKSTRLNSSH